MYNNNTIYNEDIHINHVGDEVLIEAISNLNEARVWAPESDNDPFPWKNTNTKAEIDERNKRKTSPPKRNTKKPRSTRPHPAPSATPVVNQNPTSSPNETKGNSSNTTPYGPPRPLGRETPKQQQRYEKLQDKIAIGQAVRNEKPKNEIDYDIKQGIRPAKPSKKPNKQTKNKSGILKSAGHTALKGVAGLAATTAIKDFAAYGDPLHTAKQGIQRAKESIEKHKAQKAENSRRQELEAEYDEWKNGNNKKKALKEDCQFFIDESAGTAYYAFVIPEGA